MKLFLDSENFSNYPKQRLAYKEQLTFKVCATSKINLEQSLDSCLSDTSNQVCKINSRLISSHIEVDNLGLNEAELYDLGLKPQKVPSNLTSRKRKNRSSFKRIINIAQPLSSKDQSNKIFVTKKLSYNTGRWKEDEHRRFIEAILNFGNEWKNIQKHINSRSSTQSRSHSQKFFLKIKSSQSPVLDVVNPCLATLCEAAKKLTEKEKECLIEHLISLEYDCCSSSINQENCNSSSLKAKPLRSFSVITNYGKPSTKCTGNPIVEPSTEPLGMDIKFELMDDCDPLSPGGLTTCSTMYNSLIKPNLKHDSSFDSESNDFNIEFLNAFLHSNSRLRRVSFEENLAHNMYMFNSIKSDISPALESQVSSPHLKPSWSLNSLNDINNSVMEDEYMSVN